ncbi:MAG: adenylosuccinate lyase family protein [Proteobacteria bacterium]|nr:adenylosuccinate lyase family protein [Pseudomonadota bacterium]
MFADRNVVGTWLAVEAALASVQGELGLVPLEAAQAIEGATQVEQIDWARLRAGIRSVGRPIAPLLEQVVETGGPLVEEWLHWGATTQDIMDTASVLLIRAALSLVHRDLARLILRIAALAERHRATPVVARTNGQDAVPTTFGFLLASYAAELDRSRLRLQQSAPRVLVVQFGGAVGTLAACGQRGQEVRAALAARLGLDVPDLSWTASRDRPAEIVQLLGLLHGALGRIANDITLWSRSATAEVAEGPGGASSTMPQKRNPRASESIGAMARLARLRAGGALDFLDQSEVRQGAPWMAEWSVIPEMFMLTAASLARANELFAQLRVDPAAMRRGFAASGGHVMAEALMMTLASRIGRGRAHRLLKAALAAAGPDTPLAAAVAQSAELSVILTREDVERALDPAGYLGLAPQMVDGLVHRLRAALGAGASPAGAVQSP